MFVNFHSISDIVFKTTSDIPMLFQMNKQLRKFEGGQQTANVCQYVLESDYGSIEEPPLSWVEREGLAHCIGFVKHWLDNTVFRQKQIRDAVKPCLEYPELTNVELAWNRVIIRNFFRNEYFLFYPSERKKDFTNPIYNAGFRNMLGTFLPNFNAFLFHGAGIIINDVAAVFLAPDNGGKSAVTALAEGRAILNDDHLILSKEKEQIMIHGTPLGSLTDGRLKAKLSGIFILEKASHFELIPIKPQQVLHFIINEQVQRWFTMPKYLRIRIFEMLSYACRQSSLYLMKFPKDFIDWSAINASLPKK